MDLKVLKETEYIPEWNKNKKDTHPVKFKLHFLTPSERDDCYEWQDGSLVPMTQKFFMTGVLSIENLNVNGEKITTARQLLDTPGLGGLYNEVCPIILRQNARQDSKN